MDYKEKYEQALERMKSWAKGEHPECFSEAQKAAEFIFPELEEKNEKIREGLIKAFRTVGKFEWGGLNVQDILTWLEKQGEQNTLNPDKVIEWLKHCNITNCDMRTSIIPDSSPTSIPHRVRWFSEDFIDKFKKDFGL